jgi:hypothetical protein
MFFERLFSASKRAVLTHLLGPETRLGRRARNVDSVQEKAGSQALANTSLIS